jgi:hypothetical protein
VRHRATAARAAAAQLIEAGNAPHADHLHARSLIGICVPTYFVYNAEVPFSNWDLASNFPLKATSGELLTGGLQLGRR